KLPPEQRRQIDDALLNAAQMTGPIEFEVTGVRNMGNGVSVVLESEDLARLRENFRTAFKLWLGPQDLEPWRPHVTVQ
ncbi:2'-5' RNA ligase family protein, partial [Rhizobium ruizarguesonis]